MLNARRRRRGARVRSTTAADSGRDRGDDAPAAVRRPGPRVAPKAPRGSRAAAAVLLLGVVVWARVLSGGTTRRRTPRPPSRPPRQSPARPHPPPPTATPAPHPTPAAAHRRPRRLRRSCGHAQPRRRRRQSLPPSPNPSPSRRRRPVQPPARPPPRSEEPADRRRRSSRATRAARAGRSAGERKGAARPGGDQERPGRLPRRDRAAPFGTTPLTLKLRPGNSVRPDLHPAGYTPLSRVTTGPTAGAADVSGEPEEGPRAEEAVGDGGRGAQAGAATAEEVLFALTRANEARRRKAVRPRQATGAASRSRSSAHDLSQLRDVYEAVNRAASCRVPGALSAGPRSVRDSPPVRCLFMIAI